MQLKIPVNESVGQILVYHLSEMNKINFVSCKRPHFLDNESLSTLIVEAENNENILSCIEKSLKLMHKNLNMIQKNIK